MSICRRYGVIISGCPDASFTNSPHRAPVPVVYFYRILQRFLRNLFSCYFLKGLPGASVFRGQKPPCRNALPVRRIDNRYYRNMRYGGLEILVRPSGGRHSKPALSIALSSPSYSPPMACSNICLMGHRKMPDNTAGPSLSPCRPPY